MKKKSIILCVVFLMNCFVLQGQNSENIKYSRSSLHTILLESNEFPNGGKEVIINAYRSFPFPDKYNNHKIKEDVIFSENYIDVLNLPEGEEKPRVTNKNAPLLIESYFKDKKIANQLVAKWFNRDSLGGFDIELVGLRGYYDASEMEKEIAKSTVRGIKKVEDKGTELISNTFVVVSKLKYISNETLAHATYLIASDAISKIPDGSILAGIANRTAKKIYEKTRKGYSVWTKSYLYKLKWDLEIEIKFYMDYWINKGDENQERKEFFDNSNLFQLELVGSESSKNIILFTGGKTTNTSEKIITKATIRNIEKVFTKLQKTYDVFKTKTPILSTKPIIAKIGLKEGLTGKESFEALEIRKDEVTSKTFYVRVGTLKVNKKKIWDNRYGANEDEESKNINLKGTHFKGCKKCYPGILIKQIK